ncbi:MAG: tetratricopeptide repeat protein [Acidobacteriota bacterium]
MTRILLFTAFLCAFLCGGISCSRTGAGGDPSNANSAPQQAQYPDASSALSEGNRLLDLNMTEQAIDAYKQAVNFDPDLAEAYFKLGIAYALVEAEQKGKLSADPQLPGEQTKKEPKTKSEKAFEHAIESYKKWIAANPNDDVAQFNLARSYNKLNQDTEAEKAFRQAVKLKPDDGEYQTQLGAILIKLAKYREAIDPLKIALDLDPDNSEAQELLDDAEAGRARIDYVPSKNDNRSANSNSNANVNGSNTNSGSKSEVPANRPAANDKKNPPEAKPKVTRTPAPGEH